MRVLIVESNSQLAQIWQSAIARRGAEVTLVASQRAAIRAIQVQHFDVIVMNLIIGDGSAFAVADFAAYRLPDTKVIFATDTTFFSDGSIFRHIPNVCAFVETSLPADDLCAMVDHFGAGH